MRKNADACDGHRSRLQVASNAVAMPLASGCVFYVRKCVCLYKDNTDVFGLIIGYIKQTKLS